VLENIQTEEEKIVTGQRLPVGEEERLFYKNTAQREEDNIKALQQHIFQASSDESSNLCLNENECPGTELDISSSSKTLTPTSEYACSNDIPSHQAPSRDQVTKILNMVEVIFKFSVLVTSYVPQVAPA
jgi:hypothetical protein